jgi:protein TonB
MTIFHGLILGLGYQIDMPKSLVHQFSLNLSQETSLPKSESPKNIVKALPLSTPKNVLNPVLPLNSVANETLSEAASTTQAVTEARVQDLKQKYFSEITHEIHKHKYYPRRAYTLNQEGLVLVALKLGKKGNILDLFLVEECPFESLNHAALDTISGIGKFPPIPDELGMNELTLKIPVEYKIKM